MISDPISDMIIRIKNGSKAKKPFILIKRSKFAENVAHALKKAGFLSKVEKTGETDIELGLVYINGESRIHDAERISKPSRRMYYKAKDLRSYKSGFGNYVLSTPKGIMTDIEAKKNNVGGEILFKIW